MKKVLTMFLMIIVMVTGLVSIVAAATVNDIVTALNGASVPEVYVLQAKSYLDSRTVSSAQADQVIVHINNAKAIAAGETKASKLTATQKSGILQEIIAAAAVLNLQATYANHTLTVKDSSNKIVFTVSSAEVIKQTGHDYSIALFGLGFLLLAAGAGFVLYKKASANR